MISQSFMEIDEKSIYFWTLKYRFPVLYPTWIFIHKRSLHVSCKAYFSNGESGHAKVRMVITEFLLSWAHCYTPVSLRFVFHCNTCRINQKNILPRAPVNVWACSFELIMEPLSWYLIIYCINVKVIPIARYGTLKFT